MKKKKLIYGVGINDANYSVHKYEIIEGIRKQTWVCPFYSKWVGMIRRAYSQGEHKRHPSYIGCSTIPEWHYFMTFRAWMETQDWDGKELDKDLLVVGNKVYGPNTCVFVDAKVNTFLTECNASRGEWPIGVYFQKDAGKYRAMCSDPKTGKRKSLGYFSNSEEAHKAWLDKKIELAYDLASEQSDPRIASALIDRYENYHKYFGGVSSHV